MIRFFSSKENQKKAFLVLAVFIFIVALIFYATKPFLVLFKDPESIRAFILGFGPYAPLVFILLQIAQVIITPIPGQLTGLASGYLFGWKLGILYTMLGLAIGSFLAFFFSRKLGRPFVEKVVDKQALKKFDYLSTHKGPFALFMLFLLPAFPDDTICFIAGLTAIPLRQLMLIAVVGRFPGMLILNLVGNGFAKQDIFVPVLLVSVLLVASILAWIYKAEIEEYYHKRSV